MEFDLHARRPVWDALSSLFLDTDTSLMRDWRASQLAASPYSLAELERILMDQVYPVCRWNLLQVAGEWAGFDLAWLESRILARRASPFRLFELFDVFRRSVRHSSEWQATKSAVIALRTESGPDGVI
jgi:hypothetical protein